LGLGLGIGFEFVFRFGFRFQFRFRFRLGLGLELGLGLGLWLGFVFCVSVVSDAFYSSFLILTCFSCYDVLFHAQQGAAIRLCVNFGSLGLVLCLG
jgi:hypothetical protein